MSRETGHSREAELATLNAEKEDLLLRLKQVEEKIRQLEDVGDEVKQDESEPRQETPNAEIIKQLGLEWFFKLNLDEIRKGGLPPELEKELDRLAGLVPWYINRASEPGIKQDDLDEIKDRAANIKEEMEWKILDQRSVADTLLPGCEWESDGVQKIVKKYEDGSPAIVWRIQKVPNHPYNVEIAAEIPTGAYWLGIGGNVEDYFDIQGKKRIVQREIEPAVFVLSGKPFKQLETLVKSFAWSKEPHITIAGHCLVKKGKLDCTPAPSA